MTLKVPGFNLLNLIKCDYASKGMYKIFEAAPATGILYVTDGSPYFLSGHLRLRGKENGKYPYRYLEMLESVFGPEPNTIEVCHSIVGLKNNGNVFTVDINPDMNPDVVDDGQELSQVEDNSFDRYRCDPPYNAMTALEMYNTSMPDTGKLLAAGARVCKANALLFLLLGAENRQWCPFNVKRIGWIAITVVPNNEVRALNIFYKYE
jgi:hypothetical protein